MSTTPIHRILTGLALRKPPPYRRENPPIRSSSDSSICFSHRESGPMLCSCFSIDYRFDRFIAYVQGANLYLPLGTSLVCVPKEQAIILKPNCAESPTSIQYLNVFARNPGNFLHLRSSVGNAPQATLLHLGCSSNQQCGGPLIYHLQLTRKDRIPA